MHFRVITRHSHTFSFTFMNRRDRLQFRLKLYKLREKRDISAQAFSNLVSGMLYEKRFSPYFVEPVIAGLTRDNKPYLCATDLIGFDAWHTLTFGQVHSSHAVFRFLSAPCFAKDFVLAGNSEDNLYGTCESFYKPDLGVYAPQIARIDKTKEKSWLIKCFASPTRLGCSLQSRMICSKY